MIKKENVYLFGATFLWALGLIIGKFCSTEIPPMTSTFIRYLLAGLGMGIIHFFKEKEFYIEIKDLLYLLLLSFLGIVLNGVLFFKGITMTSPINTAIISSTTPVIVYLINILFFKKINIKNIIAMLFSISGIILLLTDGNINFLLSIHFKIGDLIILGAVISNSIYIIGSKKILEKYSSTKILTFLFAFATLILLPTLYIENKLYEINKISSKAVISLIYMGLFSSLVAFLLQQKGIKKIGPIKASMYTNLIPIFSIILSFLILKEKITLIQLIAMFLVMVSLIISQNI